MNQNWCDSNFQDGTIILKTRCIDLAKWFVRICQFVVILDKISDYRNKSFDSAFVWYYAACCTVENRVSTLAGLHKCGQIHVWWTLIFAGQIFLTYLTPCRSVCVGRIQVWSRWICGDFFVFAKRWHHRQVCLPGLCVCLHGEASPVVSPQVKTEARWQNKSCR